MSKYIKLEDIKNALIELARSKKWLGRETTTNIINALVNLPTIEVSEDCISREWLVNHFKDIVEHYEMRIKRVKSYGKKIAYDPSEQIGYWKDEIAVCKHFIKEIEDAPSVVPTTEQSSKVGEWEKDEYGIPHCSECNCINNTVYRSYCPNCGAKMKG